MPRGIRGFQKGHQINKGLTGEKSPTWKGGTRKSTKGYILLRRPNHPFCDCKGYIHRSRLTMEKHLSRYLKREEVVHHKGIKYPLGSKQNKQDDRIENLQLFDNGSNHTKYHCNLLSSLTKILTLPQLERLISN